MEPTKVRNGEIKRGNRPGDDEPRRNWMKVWKSGARERTGIKQYTNLVTSYFLITITSGQNGGGKKRHGLYRSIRCVEM
jgi:hypothetical protein